MFEEHASVNRERRTSLRPRVHGPIMVDRTPEAADYTIPPELGLIAVDRSSAIRVEMRPYLVIGRKSSMNDRDININLAPVGGLEHGVSRYHAMVLSLSGYLTVKDLNSRNGTYLNGQALLPMKEYLLRHGDRLSIAGLELRVVFVGVGAPAYS